MFVRLSRPARLLAAVLCMSLASTLMGAASPFGSAPTIVLFPLRTAEGLDPRYGSDYIAKIATVLKKDGSIKVVMGDPATTPADFLHVTKVAGGDYYLIGFVAPPVNNAMAVIEQVVSARSGTIVWSNTAHIGSDQDVFDQGPVVEHALVAYASRGYFAILNPTPKPVIAATPPPPKKNGFSGPGSSGTPTPPLDLPNEAYGFSSKPTAPPKIYASATHPSRFVVLAISGKYTVPTMRDYATASLITALARHGQTAAEGDPTTTAHPLLRGADICGQTGAGYIVFGSLATKSTDATWGDQLWVDASYIVAIYDCASQKLEQTPKPIVGSASSWKRAIDFASNALVTNYILKVSAAVAHA